MIRLNRIYTRTGDDGSTMLGDGSRVTKNNPRVEAYGDVDELNAFIGVAITHSEKGPLQIQLQAIQNTLFDVSSDLCVPLPPSTGSGASASTGQNGVAPPTPVPEMSKPGKISKAANPAKLGKVAKPAAAATLPGRDARQTNHPRLPASRATELEQWIDAYNLHLKALDSFILPGGSALAADLHVARCVCRRAERRILTLAQAEPINPDLLKYINRLSDYLFVASRLANALTGGDVKWKPGK